MVEAKVRLLHGQPTGNDMIKPNCGNNCECVTKCKYPDDCVVYDDCVLAETVTIQTNTEQKEKPSSAFAFDMY